MKRLKKITKRSITIFLSSIITVGLWADGVPVTVVGDVYNNGPMKSMGTVHLKAIVGDGTTNKPDKVAKIDNYENLVVEESIIFYTNDKLDGLLKNNAGGTVTIKDDVIVRKKIVKPSIDYKWYTMSLPFDVDLNGNVGIKYVKSKTEIVGLTRGEEYEIKFYDSQERATSGEPGEKNWKPIPHIDSHPLVNVYKDQYLENSRYKNTSDFPLYNFLPRGKGFMIAVKHENLPAATTPLEAEIDFVLYEPVAGSRINTNYLFDGVNDKGVDLVYKFKEQFLRPGPDPSEYNVREYDISKFNSDGWNVIGGLNSDDFITKTSVNDGTSLVTLGYNKAIYFVRNGGYDWEQYLPQDNTIVGLLRPYGAIFTKIASSYSRMFISTNTRVAGYGGFPYYYEGNTLKNTVTGIEVIFRSTQNQYYLNDLFRIDISAENEDFNTSRIYFKFSNDYSDRYRDYEDDIVYDIYKSDSDIKAWSLAKYEGVDYYNCLFSNALPYGSNEVPLGINIPAAGKYIFSLNHINVAEYGETESVILWDKQKDIKIELLQSDYEFEASSDFYTEERFVLFFNNSDYTALDKMPDPFDPYAYAENNMLMVKNLLPGDRVQVVDLTGRTIALGTTSGDMFTTSLKQKGIYIVRVSSGKTLKVLNK